jgi:hypothetical protein
MLTIRPLMTFPAVQAMETQIPCCTQTLFLLLHLAQNWCPKWQKLVPKQKKNFMFEELWFAWSAETVEVGFIFVSRVLVEISNSVGCGFRENLGSVKKLAFSGSCGGMFGHCQF